jgi:hypothetical protein
MEKKLGMVACTCHPTYRGKRKIGGGKHKIGGSWTQQFWVKSDTVPPK